MNQLDIFTRAAPPRDPKRDPRPRDVIVDGTWTYNLPKNETQNVRRELAAAVAIADERKRLLDIFLCKMTIR